MAEVRRYARLAQLMSRALRPYSAAMLGSAMLKLLPEKGVRKLLRAMVSCTALLSTAKHAAPEPFLVIPQGLNKSFQVDAREVLPYSF